ncbi:MAG: 2Fe-2S iron-sulfur cluster-binding protein [Planctomycetota bacterium]|nr:2Fe-2S iron-sulfur cluster-binding protein [Planctomycetota bacterium]
MPTITFVRDGSSIQVPAGGSFLKACQDEDAPHDFGCTVGSCGTCVLVFTAGADNVAPPSKDEMETLDMCTDVKGARLGCQLVVKGDIAVKPL